MIKKEKERGTQTKKDNWKFQEQGSGEHGKESKVKQTTNQT